MDLISLQQILNIWFHPFFVACSCPRLSEVAVRRRMLIGMVVGGNKVKGKIIPVHTVKGFVGSKGIDPLFLNLSTSWGWLVNFTCWLPCPWKRTLVRIKKQAR